MGEMLQRGGKWGRIKVVISLMMERSPMRNIVVKQVPEGAVTDEVDGLGVCLKGAIGVIILRVSTSDNTEL